MTLPACLSGPRHPPPGPRRSPPVSQNVSSRWPASSGRTRCPWSPWPRPSRGDGGHTWWRPPGGRLICLTRVWHILSVSVGELPSPVLPPVDNYINMQPFNIKQILLCKDRCLSVCVIVSPVDLSNTSLAHSICVRWRAALACPPACR